MNFKYSEKNTPGKGEKFGGRKDSFPRGSNSGKEKVNNVLNKAVYRRTENSLKPDSRRLDLPVRSPKSTSSRGTFERSVSYGSIKSSSGESYGGDSAQSIEKKSPTSWGAVARWYDNHLEVESGTYHTEIVYPHLERLIGNVKSKYLTDIACGQGQFARMMCKGGAQVTGVDISRELIILAENHARKEHLGARVHFVATPSSDLFMIPDESQDVVTCILALQNIEELASTMKEASRVLKTGGVFYFVINHPSFRNPRNSAWAFDEKKGIQFRRVDEYLSESKIKMDMTPGSEKNKIFTVSYHRPLQVFVKALTKAGFMMSLLEEWESKKTSVGTRAAAENKSRKEFPLFMCVGATKIAFGK